MAAAQLSEEMVASYSVTIEGVGRTRKQMEALDNEIKLLRSTSYSGGQRSVSVAASAERTGNGRGKNDIFATKFKTVEGRIQTGVGSAMSSAMALGKRVQAMELNAAETATGAARVAAGGGGTTGRNTGKAHGMINSLATNVESFRGPDFTSFTGWHGWARDARKHFEFQELGTRGKGGGSAANSGISRKPNKPRGRYAGQKRSGSSGVPAANSLGLAIPVVREHLKTELRKIKP